MDLFNRTDLLELLQHQTPPCVSLLMPTTRGGQAQDLKSWSTRIGEAEERLRELGVRPPDADNLLRPARNLLSEPPFWLNVSNGLAGFLSPGFARFYRVPYSVPDEVLVGSAFHVKPILPLLHGEGRFYLLILSDRDVRLLQCTEQTVHEFDLQSEGREGLLRGLGISGDTTKRGLLNFFQEVDRRLHPFFESEDKPVLLAGPLDVLKVYRGTNRYQHLLPEDVDCRPDTLTVAQLRDRAWPVVQRYFQDARGKYANLYHQFLGTGHASGDLEQILNSAHQGQVMVLFTALGRAKWGKFDAATGKVEVHERAEANDEDLLNLAAVHTLAHRGHVYAVAPNDVPGGGLIAALYRISDGERRDKRVIAEALRA
jgi:hypothetical protein